MAEMRRNDIVHAQLSYNIVGCAYEVYNELGKGLLEKQYQKAMAIEFSKRGITFQEQVYYPLEYMGEKIAKGFLDFLVENQIVVELKRGEHFSRNNINQVKGYLEFTGLQLGLLIHFGGETVKYKRILNINQ